MLPGFPQAEPVMGLIGGLLIGIAAALFLLGSGRIAGVSGLFARATGIAPGRRDVGAVAFVLALVAGGWLADLALGGVDRSFPASPWVLIAGGLLVGFGTRLGSGCTSGHGVCGMSRLSRRSFVATLVFMGAGIATVAAMRAAGVTP